MANDTDGKTRVVAERFVAARRGATVLPDYPGAMPTDLATAYAIQDDAIRLYGDQVAGWKVGRVPPPLVDTFGAERLGGPIFKTSIRRASSDEAVAMPMFQGGFGAAEAEFLMRIRAGAPMRDSGFTREEAIALIDEVHVGIEIASSPFPGINDHGPAVTASDFGNNHGLVIGPAIADWHNSGYETWPVVTEIDGIEVGRSTVSEMLDGAVGAVRFLLDLLGRRGIAIPEGLWVSTGAVTGVHGVKPGQVVRARFGDALSVECKIVAER